MNKITYKNILFVNTTLQLVLMLFCANTLGLTKRFQKVHNSEGVSNLTLAKFPGSSNIGCARLCFRYPGCTSFSFALGLCTIWSTWHNVRREQGGVTYIMKEVVPSCIQEGGENGGHLFNLSSAYYASYHQITSIRFSYGNTHQYGYRPIGLEVHHGTDVAHTGNMNGDIEECQLMDGEFIQSWEYSTYMYRGIAPVIRCNTLVTTHKTCGPYGTSCGTMEALEGYHLLYIAGRRGNAFDRLSLAFDAC